MDPEELHPNLNEENTSSMLDKIKLLNDEADRFKESCRLRRFATLRSLNVLYEALAEFEKEQIAESLEQKKDISTSD